MLSIAIDRIFIEYNRILLNEYEEERDRFGVAGLCFFFIRREERYEKRGWGKGNYNGEHMLVGEKFEK